MQLTNFRISRSPCITDLNDIDEVERAVNFMKSLPVSSSDWKARVVFHSVSGDWFCEGIDVNPEQEKKLLDNPTPQYCME